MARSPVVGGKLQPDHPIRRQQPYRGKRPAHMITPGAPVPPSCGRQPSGSGTCILIKC